MMWVHVTPMELRIRQAANRAFARALRSVDAGFKVQECFERDSKEEVVLLAAKLSVRLEVARIY